MPNSNAQSNTNSISMNLSGKWKSVNFNTVISDGGEYEIFQDGNDLVITGHNDNKGWANLGFGKLICKGENDNKKWFAEVFWMDTQSSTVEENKVLHACEIEVISNTELKQTLHPKSKPTFAYGDWIRI